jgi:hypothetical protein
MMHVSNRQRAREKKIGFGHVVHFLDARDLGETSSFEISATLSGLNY